MSERIKGELYVFLLALLCAGLGVFRLSTAPDLERMTAIAHSAEVTYVSVYEDDDGDKDYTPTFTFTDSDQRTFEARSFVDYPQAIRVGARFDVRYDPYRPKAGCLIVGHEQRLRGHTYEAYVFLFAGIALIAYVICREVRLRRASGSPDEASG